MIEVIIGKNPVSFVTGDPPLQAADPRLHHVAHNVIARPGHEARLESECRGSR